MATLADQLAHEQIKVEGLRDLQRDLRRMDKDAPREIRLMHREVAEPVVATSVALAESLGGVAAKVAPSIRVLAEQRAVGLKFGGARYPMAMGANFGAYHNVDRIGPSGRRYVGYHQFPRWGGNQWTGGAADRFVFRAIASHDIEGMYAKAFDEWVDRSAHFK